jgi:hypothetical protein
MTSATAPPLVANQLFVGATVDNMSAAILSAQAKTDFPISLWPKVAYLLVAVSACSIATSTLLFENISPIPACLFTNPGSVIILIKIGEKLAPLPGRHVPDGKSAKESMQAIRSSLKILNEIQ